MCDLLPGVRTFPAARGDTFSGQDFFVRKLSKTGTTFWRARKGVTSLCVI